MEIFLNDSKRIVEIWLTNAEKTDEALRQSLKPVYAGYRQLKYTVAVFESGDGDLLEGTKDLLLHNKA